MALDMRHKWHDNGVKEVIKIRINEGVILMSIKTVRATLTLPDRLLAAADEAVKKGKARSRNELVAVALQHELAAHERAEIDAAFAGMADDAAYQMEAQMIAAEFSEADWEALRESEDVP